MQHATTPDGLPLLILTSAELGSFAMTLPLMMRVDELDTAVTKLEAMCAVPFIVTAMYPLDEAADALIPEERACVVRTRAAAREMCDRWRAEPVFGRDSRRVRPRLVKFEPEGMLPVATAQAFVREVILARRMVGNVHLMCQGKSVAVYEFTESEFSRAKYGASLHSSGIPVEVMDLQRPRTPKNIRVIPTPARPGPLRGRYDFGALDDYHFFPTLEATASRWIPMRKSYDVPQMSTPLDNALPTGVHSWVLTVRTQQGEEEYYEDAKSGDAARVQLRKRVSGILKVVSCKQISRDRDKPNRHGQAKRR